MHSVPRGLEDAGRVLLREVLGQLARIRPEAFFGHCLASAHSRFSTFRRAATRAGPAMRGADEKSRQAEHRHELEVARLEAVVAGFPAAGGEASRFPSSYRRACHGAGGSRRRRSQPACGRDSRRCAVPWWNVFGPSRAGVPSDLARSGRMPPSAPRGAGDLGTCASEVSGLRPQPCQLVEGLCPSKSPRYFLGMERPRCNGGGSQVNGRTLASPPPATIGHRCSLFLARLPPGRAARPLRLPFWCSPRTARRAACTPATRVCPGHGSNGHGTELTMNARS